MIGRVMEWLGLPGVIRPFEYRDDATGCVVSLRTSPRYSILTVNGRELFFCRESGRYDGDGAMVLDGAPPIRPCLRVVSDA